MAGPILVFGKNGPLAIELQRHAEREGLALQAYSSEEANFTQPEKVVALVRNAPPGTVVINASAYTAVDKAESEPELAKQLNETTPGLIAQACAERGFPLIHISTDYVFPGDQSTPYVETDATWPATVYGQTKLEGEKAILSSGCRTFILRTSWVFSSHGKNFVKTMLRLGKERETVTVVSDQHGCPTSASSIAKTCLILASKSRELPLDSPAWGVYHYSGQPTTTWNQFAEEIFQQAGLKVAVTPILSKDYPTPAKRPLWSVMSCKKIQEQWGIEPADWRDELRMVLRELDALSIR